MVIMAAPSMRIKAAQSAGVVWSEQASSGWVTLRSRNCTKLGIAVASGKSNSPVAPGGARACIDLGVPPQRGPRSLYSRSCCAAEARRLLLRFLLLALGISPRRQCPDHFRGILLGHAVRVGDAGMNAVESIEAIGPNAVDAPL